MRDKRLEIINNEFMILQCNLNKNQSIMNNLLNNSYIKKFMILIIQEYQLWYIKLLLIYHS